MNRPIFTLCILLLNISAAFSQNFEEIFVSQNFEYPMQVETIDFDGDGLDDFLAMGYK